MRQVRTFSFPRAAGVWALLLPGVVALQPAFGGMRGYAAAFTGITVGAAIGMVATRFRGGIVLQCLALLLAYLLLGGPLVLPGTTVAGFLPSLGTIRGLALLTFRSWSDLLTVATPAGDLSGPAAVPLIAGLLAGHLAARSVFGTRLVFSPILIPLGWLGFCIAFGVRTAPTAAWLGVAMGMGILMWLTVHRLAAVRSANTQILLRQDTGLSRNAGRAIAAGLVITLAAIAALGMNLMTGDRVNRQVLRDDVTPPLNLRELVSPLMKYRLYELTLKDEVLFVVRGMPPETRLRLAVLDTYDGTVFNVSQHANQYLNVGRELPLSPAGETTEINVSAVAYNDVWVPTMGNSSRVTFTGFGSEEQAEGLFYSRESQQLLTTAGLSEGSVWQLEAVPTIIPGVNHREAIAGAGIGRAPLAEVTRVPDVLIRAATDWTAEATSSFEQLEIIASQMRSQGFYSDGSDGIARSGHTTERLSTMFNAAQWVGDDEQYATAMALMATQLGIPARVVMGFHPTEGDPPADVWEVKGTEAHVWVEADLDGAGWVVFDPTPARDKVPQTEVPRPQPQPKPQVDPPPNPPERLPEEPIVADEDAVNVDEEETDDEDEGQSSYLVYLLVGAVAVLGVAAAPFLVILAVKSRRTTRRRTSGAITDQLAGAWDEVVDRARDLGYSAPTSRTRRESATHLQQAYPDTQLEHMAQHLDAVIFGAGDPHEGHRDQAWSEARRVKAALLATAPWHRRPGALLSTQSLKRRGTEVGGRRTARRAKAGVVIYPSKESR